MAFDLNLPIRSVQFLFAVIALGLNGYGMSLPFLLVFPFPPLCLAFTSSYNAKSFSNPNPHHIVTHQFDIIYSDIVSGFYGDVPSELSFIVFVSVWTMVVTIYLLVAPLNFPRLAPVIAVLALDALTMLFWFAAFIALAVWKSNLGLCFGRICNTIVAGIVFGAFEWLVFFFFLRIRPILL